MNEAPNTPALVSPEAVRAVTLRRQVVPAAVCDATLVTIGLNLLEFVLFVAWCRAFDWNSSLSTAVILAVPLVMLFSMVSAPIAYRIIWSLTGKKVSPGEGWLELGASESTIGQNVASDLKHGSLACLVSVTFVLLLFKAAEAMGVNLWLLPRIDVIAILSLTPLIYGITLSVLMSRKQMLVRKKMALDYSLEAAKKAQAILVVQHERSRVANFMSLSPLALVLILMATAPAQLMTLFSTGGGKLLFVNLIFWILWARPLVRYSKSILVVLLYSLVFVLPFVAWLILGASLMHGISLRM